MRAVVQRVSRASVRVDGELVGAVEEGLLVLVGITHVDDEASAAALARKIHGLRVLHGESSVADRPDETAVLAVSQFTLYADTRKGRRPSWSAAAPAERAAPLFDAFVAALRGLGTTVATGIFGAHMAVELVNDGPVTVLLEI